MDSLHNAIPDSGGVPYSQPDPLPPTDSVSDINDDSSPLHNTDTGRILHSNSDPQFHPNPQFHPHAFAQPDAAPSRISFL